MDVTLGEVGWVDRARLGIAQSNRYISPMCLKLASLLVVPVVT